MKLSISNIAWDKEYDLEIYRYMQEREITGLEIAPTRLFEKPYSNINEVAELSSNLKKEHNLAICSMQSIWYGRSESIYNAQERKTIYDYSLSAIEFAAAANIGNIVFGCPKNRNIPEDKHSNDIITDKELAFRIAEEFLFRLAEYSYENGTVFAVEPNPDIYGTNFINTTQEAFSLAKKINSKGLKVNVDIGTMINQGESPKILLENKELVNHIHLSVPYLEYVEYHPIHEEIKTVLSDMKYKKYLSIEMKNFKNIDRVKTALDYLVEFFKDEKNT